MIEAIDKPISGELIDEIRKESIETGKSMSLIAKDKLAGIVNVKLLYHPKRTSLISQLGQNISVGKT